ncbi:three-Cys-motif partner protein TcmP [Flavihumibacter stibioxidans]|uniref:GMT-like wHTH domain-containing protein n=1 Tax=Flavihumibacter stibioxidans TaxID=1834163 RepID=A0ABR7MET3_9BACT|nr:three-Cys-motif partner protein TcmP [Flavihumibacter stibioxidans]MBC6493029.1 hypothetical protein [Flavihumibacter stibioxidans]
MPYKDLHSEPFDETTKTKLEIFEDYAEAWLPTFITQKVIPKIQIFDFFSGPGYDQIEVPGSPIRLLNKINTYLGLFFKTDTKIELYFNEFEPNKYKQQKFELLKQNVEEYLNLNPKLRHFVSIQYFNEDADTLFFKLLPNIKSSPSLVYLDQNGVKFISQQFLNELEKLKAVDFIYFVSSSYFWRLGSAEEFKRVLNIDMDDLKQNKYQNVHRFILNEVKRRLPESTNLQLFPFSLRKGANIYGIIFGAKHYRAVDKFLDIAWRRNATNGEANFDIDEDAKKVQGDLFGGRQMTKVEKFKEELEVLILSGHLINNMQVLIYTYESGHIPGHSTTVLKKLKKEEKIDYSGLTPGISYENVFKKKIVVNYTIK